MILDKWQDVLNTEGHICLRSGRQVGKSTIISIKAAEFALKNPNKTVLVIASVERQAYLLFEKILSYILDNNKQLLSKGKDRPTKTILKLKNGSKIYCLPTGISGSGIRGFTIDLLIADEAAFIPEEVWSAVTPMLSTTKGTLILLSTPKGKISSATGKDSYFYKCFFDENFTKFHVSSEDCPRMDKEFLKREKITMTKLQYAQEYLGEFLDELMQYFSSQLIRDRMLIDESDSISPKKDYFLGIDVGRYGGDESSYVIVERNDDKTINVKKILTSKNVSTAHVIGQVIKLNEKWDFKKIYIDDGGLGAPVFDVLFEHDDVKRKIVGINNARKSIEKEGDANRRRRIMKEDLYSNLLMLMQSDKVNLTKTPELYQSLTSVQYEYTTEGTLKIFGNYTHITEGLIRAVWCIKDKSLNIWIY